MRAAIIGSGNIGTDLMMKMLRRDGQLKLIGMIGIDPESEGLARARENELLVSSDGLEGFARDHGLTEIDVLFDATSAKAHARHAEIADAAETLMIDMTPAAIGPYVVPVVNADIVGTRNVNMVTCGGQATIPIVAAISKVSRVPYAEIVASISSRSAGPGTRANIDEFTQTTASAIEKVGGAQKAKAIIILNPAEPPLLMRNTVFALSEDGDEETIRQSIEEMVAEVAAYVPGYRLKQSVQFERFGSNRPLTIPGYGIHTGLKTSVFLEVEGAADFLPAYAGNLDIMTSAALAVGERMALSAARAGEAA